MPSPQSIKHGFYYSHPQNRFWPLLAEILQESLPQTPAEKTAMVLRHGIWDVLASCSIEGASDASIRKPVPNDFSTLLKEAPIGQIFTTGKTAFRLFSQFVEPVIHRQAIYLPSTSPANQAAFPWKRLLETWKNTLAI